MHQPASDVSIQKSPLETQCPMFTSGAAHVGILPSMHQSARVPEGKQAFSINHMHVQFMHSEPHLSIRDSFICVWNCISAKFTDTEQGLTL